MANEETFKEASLGFKFDAIAYVSMAKCVYYNYVRLNKTSGMQICDYLSELVKEYPQYAKRYLYGMCKFWATAIVEFKLRPKLFYRLPRHTLEWIADTIALGSKYELENLILSLDEKDSNRNRELIEKYCAYVKGRVARTGVAIAQYARAVLEMLDSSHEVVDWEDMSIAKHINIVGVERDELH